MFSSQNSQVSSAANYIEEVFSTYLYTGNDSTQTITNGIDLASKGGLVWIKSRNLAGTGQFFQDTVRGANQFLDSTTTGANQNIAAVNTTFSTTGFSQNNNYLSFNGSSYTYASWTFRKQPKFFDVVTWTGDQSGDRTLSHTLASTPGCIIIKATNATDDWYVYHTSLGTSKFLYLNNTQGQQTASIVTAVSSTTFTVSQSNGFNTNGRTYVAYLFAHNAGGFGLTGTDNVISCGSFTTSGGGGDATVDLGYEPQWLLVKSASGTSGWDLIDNMRGMPNLGGYGTAVGLEANNSNAEGSRNPNCYPTATGFYYARAASTTYIYIAIRRGPMKVPTSGTSVFSPQTSTQTLNGNDMPSAGFPIDLCFVQARDGGLGANLGLDRLRGKGGGALQPNSTSDESWTTYFNYDRQTNLYVTGNFQGTPLPFVFWNFKRAPNFFDEVCYTGNATSGATQTHNLGVVPEMMIVKNRSAASYDWFVYHKNLTSAAYYLNLNSTAAESQYWNAWNSTQPTASVFTIGNYSAINASGNTYVAYLFATCAGVSKVGSYTGNGSTQTINCGFTGGARFVLIKRTDSTGDWYVWDTARGIVSGNDPYLLLNSTAAEVTNTDYVDTYSAGFEISSTAPAAINASGGTFIFLAIA